MNKKRFTVKALIAFVVALVILGTISTFALAGNFYENKKLAYGEIVPTDAKLKSQKFTYTFYGDKGDMYFMRLSKGVSNAYFAIEIYSDKNYKSQIRSFTKEYDVQAGNKSLKVTWEFKDKPSGTYYGRCYSYAIDRDSNKIIDTASMKTFKINIDRMSKKTVVLKTLTNSTNGPKLTWATFPTATQYKVYRRENSNQKWKLIKTLGAKTSSYTDVTAKSGKTYYYTVKCLDLKYTSLYNKKGLSIFYLATPTVSVNGSGSVGNAKVQWKAISGAKGYKVYRKGGSLSDYTWKLIATIKNGKTTYFVDKTAKSTDWNYSYAVTAFNGKTLSARSRNDVTFDYIPAPTLSGASCVDGGIKLTWKLNNPNVVKYNIYKKVGSDWKFLGTSKTKTFTDTTALSGKTYTYTVKALSDTNGGAYNAKGISKKYMGAPELSPLTFDSNYRSVIKWKPVSGAAGYKIYRKIDNAKSWTLIATIKNGKTSSYYDNYKKVSGKTYKYTVRSFDSKNYLSAYKTPATTSVCLFKPSLTAKQITSTGNSLCIEIKWGSVKGATSYNVYRRVPGGKWSTISKGTTKLSFRDTTIKCGLNYEYAVRALNKKGDISPYLTKSAMAIATPVLKTVTVTDEGTKLNWTALDNTSSYNVYRRADGNKVWKKIGTSKTNNYIDTSKDAQAKPYYYTVSAVFGSTETSKSAGIPNFIKFKLNATMVYPTDTEGAYIDVAFDYSSTQNVAVYKSINGEEALLLSGVKSSFRDTDIEEGNTYTYKVVVSEPGKIKCSESATVKYKHSALTPAIITNCIGDYNEGNPTVTLTWNKVEFADSYLIFRSEGNDEWVEIGNITVDSQETPTLPEPGEGTEGDGNAPEGNVTDGNIPEETVTDGNIPEKEEGSPDENDPDQGEPEDSDTLSFTDTDVSPETAYSYKIVAVATKSERDSSESEVATVVIFTPLDGVTGIKFAPEKNEDGTIKVSVLWDETKFAQSYTIYRKTASSEWQMLAIIPAGSENSYVDTVSINTTYSYKVVATAEHRGSVSNEEDYSWNEPLPPVQPEGDVAFTFVDESSSVCGKYIVTTTSGIEAIDSLLTVNEGYTVEASSQDVKMGTGSTVKFYKDGELVSEYTLIIKGDVTGDSICDALDISLVEKLVTGNVFITEAYIFAADVNNDNIITIEDYELISAI